MPIVVNAIRLRLPDGRYVQTPNGGGVLVPARVASPTQWETFRLIPPTSLPFANEGPIAMDPCNLSWAPSGMRVRVSWNVRSLPSRKGEDRLVAYFVGGDGTWVYATTDPPWGFPGYLDPERDPEDWVFSLIKPGGGIINDGDAVSLQINAAEGPFYFRAAGDNILGDGTSAGQDGTIFYIEFVEIRSGLGPRPSVVKCRSCAKIMGQVTRAADGNPIQGANVAALNVLGNHPFNGLTASNGNYTLSDPEGRTCIPSGNIKVSASANRYRTKTLDVAVPEDGSLNLPIQLDCTKVTVKVVDSAHIPEAGVTVLVMDASSALLLDLNGNPYIGNTGLDGTITFDCVPAGNAMAQTTADPSQILQFNVPSDGITVTIIIQGDSCGNLIGKVIADTLGAGIPGASVTIMGTNSQQTTTKADGSFKITCHRPAGQCTVTATSPGCNPQTTMWNVPMSGDSQPLVFKLQCSVSTTDAIIAKLDWGPQPPDLDNHLSGPDGHGERFHLYYGNRQNPPVPYVSLDKDDTQGAGLETITIRKNAGAFVAGEYRLWVHRFGGDTFDQSNAVLTILRVSPGFGGFPNYTQLAREEVQFATGNQSDDIWHVVNLTVDAAGTVGVTIVQTLQEGPGPTQRDDAQFVL